MNSSGFNQSYKPPHLRNQAQQPGQQYGGAPVGQGFGGPYQPQHQSMQARHYGAPAFQEAWTPYEPGIPAGNASSYHMSNQARWASSHRGGYSSFDNRGGRGGKGQRSRSAQPSPPPKRSRHQNPGRGNDSGRGGGGRGGGNAAAKGARDSGKGGKQLKDPNAIDEAWLSREFAHVDVKPYARMHPNPFKFPVSFVHESKHNIQWKERSAQRPNNDGMQVTVTAKMPDGQEFEAVGDGLNKKSAQTAAYKHLIYQLANSRVLDEYLRPATISNSEASENKDAKVHIYDYCAKFGKVPTFQYRDSLFHKGYCETVIEFPEHGIKALGRHKDRSWADIGACMEFKKQAEEYHAKHGEKVSGEEGLLISSSNATKFFQFLKIVNKGVRFEVQFGKPTIFKSKGGSSIQAQLYYNGEPVGDPVVMMNKKMAEPVAYLSGALALIEQYPKLYPEFISALKTGKGDILKPVPAVPVHPHPQTLFAMEDTIASARRVGLQPLEAQKDEEEFLRQRGPPRRLLPKQLYDVKSKELKERYDRYWTDPTIEELRTKRMDLPMNKFADKVIDLTTKNFTSIIVGETGSGKTTQVPQIILDEYIKQGRGAECNIICTQPRRIAATSVATRVAVERHEPLRKTVGYHVRFDNRQPEHGGSINFCTTGILLQQLRHNEDEALAGISHLIIDEVHERDILNDFLLILMKRARKRRREEGLPDIKIILMSATIDTELFKGYFAEMGEDGNLEHTPTLFVPGRTFPVQKYYLDDVMSQLESTYKEHELNKVLRADPDAKDYLQVEKKFPIEYNAGRISRQQDTRLAIPAEEGNEDMVIDWGAEVAVGADAEVSVQAEKDNAMVPVGLMAATVAHIARTTDEGAILIFLPGWEEIEKLKFILDNNRPLGVDFTDTSLYKVYTLHSTVPTDPDLFEPPKPGVRKVILSTNIAETSVTIPDVQFVVDSGKLREKQYDQTRRISRLLCTWVSKSNCKQRAGRAGRVQNGNYYAMFTKTRFESLRATGLPEMLRSDLQEICLDIRAQGFVDPVADFLADAIEPPKETAVSASIEHLQNLSAFDKYENITPLGKVLATLPVEPAMGKMILLGAILRCFDPMMILAASTTGRDIFIGVPDLKKQVLERKKVFADGTDSDQYATINAFRQWRTIGIMNGPHAAHRFAEDNLLHRGALKTLEQTMRQIEEVLTESKLIPKWDETRNDDGTRGHPILNQNSNSVPLIKALAIAGQTPNLAICVGGKGFRTMSDNFAMIHPSGVNYTSRNDTFDYNTIVTFGQKVRSSDGGTIYVRNVSKSTPLQTLLFGGKFSHDTNEFVVDEWLPFRTSFVNAKIITEFRRTLDQVLEHAFKTLTTRSDKTSIADDPTREIFAKGLVEVLERDNPGSSRAQTPRTATPRAQTPDSTRFGGRGDSWRPHGSSSNLQYGNPDRMSGFLDTYDTRSVASGRSGNGGSRPSIRELANEFSNLRQRDNIPYNVTASSSWADDLGDGGRVYNKPDQNASASKWGWNGSDSGSSRAPSRMDGAVNRGGSHSAWTSADWRRKN